MSSLELDNQPKEAVIHLNQALEEMDLTEPVRAVDIWNVLPCGTGSSSEQQAGYGPVSSVAQTSLTNPGLNSSSQKNNHHHASSQEVERFSVEENVMRQKEQQQQKMTALKYFKKNELTNGRDFRNEAEPRPEILKAGFIQGLWPQKRRSTHY